MINRIEELKNQIQQVKRELLVLGELRPGSLSQQFNVCGRPDCCCKADPPRKHGPYYQLSYTRKGKSHTVFVKKHQLAAVKEQLQNYAQFRKLMERRVDLSIELCREKLAAE
jgi:hypothetical protein